MTRPVIASGASIRDIVYSTIEADSTLLALLTGGANSVLPRRGIDPGKAAKPFVFVRLEGIGGGGDNMDTGTWAIEVHDRPGYGLLTIDKIVDRLKVLFNHQNWPKPSGSIERPRKSYWAGATGELPDDGLNTLKRIARFQIIQS
jgi:hypothetical protein